MSLRLELMNIKACWNKKFPDECYDENIKSLYDEILGLEAAYNEQLRAIINKEVKHEKITQANENLCCHSEECMELIRELSNKIGCESEGQTRSPVQTKTLDKGARPGVVSLRPYIRRKNTSQKIIPILQ